MTYQIKTLATPIPVRPYEDDFEIIKQLSDNELRPQSVIVRTLIHEAICMRMGITETVRVPIVGKLSNIDPINEIENRQTGEIE